MMTNIDLNFEINEIIESSLDIFKEQYNKYGPSFAGFRLTSLTDQAFIKIKRIIEVDKSKKAEVDESLYYDFIAIINYSIIYFIIFSEPKRKQLYDIEYLIETYKMLINDCIEVMERKNKDYGEVWKEIKIQTLMDLTLAKFMRIKKMEDNFSENEDKILSDYQDIINYTLFMIIRGKYDDHFLFDQKQ